MKGRTSPLLFCAGALVASAAESTTTSAPLTPARPTSTQTAERLKSELPRFTPPPPAEPLPAPFAARSSATPREPLDLTAAPGDDVVRLPRYEVREREFPRFRERELLTRAGRIDLVLRRHPGLKLGPLAKLNLRRGLEILADEQQLERNREFAELAGFQRFVFATRSRSSGASASRVAAE